MPRAAHNIFYTEQNGACGACRVDHLTGVQAHRAMPNAGELVLDFIIFHDAVLGYDLFEQHAKLWDVPLSIAQRVKKSALCILGPNLEPRIEGSASSDHT